MTCAFCQYEFCWACGASATTAENHFGAYNGCGIGMMEENIKPGDHLKITLKSKCKKIAWKVLKAILFIVFFPVIVVFYVPYTLCKSSLESSRNQHWCLRTIRVISAFICGMISNVVMIPIMLAGGLVVIVQYTVYYTFYIVFCCCIIQYVRNRYCRRSNNEDLAA